MSTKLTDRASVKAIINEMSLEEKAGVITGGSLFYTESVEKYGIPKALFLDGGTGINYGQLSLEMVFQAYYEVTGRKLDKEEFTSGMGGFSQAMELIAKKPSMDVYGKKDEASAPLTDEEKRIFEVMDEKLKALEPGGDPIGCYPPGMLLGATWNPEAIYECGHALGKEANAHGVDVLLGTPNVNIHRDPLNGRLFEGYSEDPCLVSKLAPNLVRAVQEEGVIADVKHYAANNQETNRMGVNEHIPERALREIYLPGFGACVKEGCKTVMSAYNLINGVPCAMNQWLLDDVLRKEWGFDGFVVSDWSAAYEQAEACAAGNDVVMPGPRQISPLVNAVKTGELDEKKLDVCVENYLNVLLEMPVMKGRKYTSIDQKPGSKAAYEAAKEGITLLKNDGVLPLSKDSDICFYGPRSRKFVESGAGSAQVLTPLTTNMYDCTADKLGTDKVTFESITENTQAVIVTIGANGQEGADRIDMDVEPEDKKILKKALQDAKTAGRKIIVVLNTAGPVSMMEWIDHVDAVLCVFLPGMKGGQAAADILFGDVNPSGKLPLTFPMYYSDCPTYGNFPGEFNEVWYGEGIYVGYRYYDKKGIEPLFPFGYGLSYTTFAMSELTVPETANVDTANVKVSIKVKNTGDRAGSEVVQVYIHDVSSTLDKPVKELKAFHKVFLEPKEEKIVTLELKKEDFASYDVNYASWITEPGSFDILVGNSSRNILLQKTTKVTCANPYKLGPNTEIAKMVSDPRAAAVINNAIHGDIKALVSIDIVFKPNTKFEDVWNKTVAPAMKGSAEKVRLLKEKIYSELEEIE